MITTIAPQLRVFMSVAKHLSVSRAARELNVTPSAISHSLEHLREVVGVALTTRTRSGIELTEAGEAVHIKAKSILFQLDSFSTMFRVPNADQPEETLAIGASHGPSIRLVPELLAHFQSQFPRLHFAVITGTCRQVELQVRKKTIEVAFLSNPSNTPALTIERFARERLLFVVAKKSPLANQKMISLAELGDLPLVVGAESDGKTPAIDVIKLKLRTKLKLNVRVTFNSPGALRAAVVKGMGVGLLYEDMVLDELRDGSLKELTVAGLNLAGHSSLVYLKDKALSPIAAKFIEVARLYRDAKPKFETQTALATKHSTLPGLIGKQQTPKQDVGRVLIER